METHYPISLAITTATAISDNLEAASVQHHEAFGSRQLEGRESVLSLATNIQTILGDAMAMATTMLPHKPTSSGKAKTPPTTYGQNRSNMMSSPSEVALKPSDA